MINIANCGVVSFISNFSYLGDPSFVVARRRFLDEFDALWFDCMNGDSRETGKLTPEGKPDPSAFSTDWNREGIRVGTAIGLFVKRGRQRKGEAVVRFRHFWCAARRADLLASLETEPFDAQYETAIPARENRWSFRPADVTAAYISWPRVSELCATPPFNGPVERRAFALIAMDRDPLVARMKAYFDKGVSNDVVAALHPALMMTGNRIVGPEARAKLLRENAYDESRIVRYPFKPFDLRWCYLDNIRPLFSEPSPQLLSNRFAGNRFLITRDTADKGNEGPPFMLSPFVCDYDCISGHARHFPIWLRKNAADSLLGFDRHVGRTGRELLGSGGVRQANLDWQARVGQTPQPMLHSRSTGIASLTCHYQGVMPHCSRIFGTVLIWTIRTAGPITSPPFSTNLSTGVSRPATSGNGPGRRLLSDWPRPAAVSSAIH